MIDTLEQFPEQYRRDAMLASHAAEVWAGALRITVTDHGHSGVMPTLREPGYTGPGGGGLRIVDALSHRWGTEQHGGTVVWAELPLRAG